MAKITTNSMRTAQNLIQARLAERIAQFQAGDPRMREKLIRIGLMISNAAKANILSKDITDTGALLNSIRYEIEQSQSQATVKVGSFGVPYAAMNEFGGIVTRQQFRAMFAAMRDRNRIGVGRNKEVIDGGVWRPRPYLSPAFIRNRSGILRILSGK